MSNVYNRRLFKPRPARAKLNQMGGIMASSVPLMQSVQKFANGTSVRVPFAQSPLGRLLNLGGSGQQRQATRAQAQEAQRLRQGQRNLIASGFGQSPIPTYAIQDPVVNIAKKLGQGIVDVVSPKDRRRPAKPVGGIQTLIEDVPPTFGQRIGAETDDAGFVGTGTELLTLDDSVLPGVGGKIVEEQLMKTRGASQGGPTAEERDEERTRIMGQSRRGPTAEEIKKQQTDTDTDAGTDEKSGEVTTDTSTDSSSNKTISEQANPAAQVSKMDVEEAVDPKSPKKAEDVVNPIAQRVLNALANQDVDGAEDIAAAAIGADEVSEIGSTNTKERIEKQRAIISEFLGVDPDEYKKDRSLALASAFFKYAQTGDIGESGNALVSNLQKIKANERARQDKIDSLALTTVLNREEKESDREFRAKQNKLTRDHDWKKTATLESGKLLRLSAEIDTRLFLADTSNALKINLKDKDIDIVNAQIRARADNIATQIASSESEGRLNRESQELRSQYAGLGEAAKLSMIEGKSLGLKGKALTNHIDKRSGEILQGDILTQTDPGTFRRTVIDLATVMIRDGEFDTFEGAANSIISGIKKAPELRKTFEKELRALGLFDESTTTTTTTTGTGSTNNQTASFNELPPG